VARIKLGLQDCLYIGNLDSKRDWGHARDYVEAQWLILQQDKPEDFVIASGEQHSVRDFVRAAADVAGISLSWSGSGVTEIATDQNGKVRVRIDPKYFRPTEVDSLLGDASKARQKLGWKPRTTFAELVQEMVTSDIAEAERDTLIKRGGFRLFNRHE
jgi:GDPmannose 4,6-dehydratase